MDNVVLTVQMQGMLLEQEAGISPDHTLFSWMEEDKQCLQMIHSYPKCHKYNLTTTLTQRGDLPVNQLLRN